MLGLLGVAALAAVLVVLATRHGVHTSPDDAVYIGTARDLATGHGLTVPFRMYPLGSVGIGTPAPGHTAPAPTPLVTYAPLEPVLLAVGGAGHVLGTARVEDACCFAAAVFLVGLFVLRLGGSVAAALAAALVVAGSLADVYIPGAGTEPAALLLTVIALGCVCSYRRRPHPAWLVGAAGAVAVASLVRFAAGGLAVWALLALLPRWRAALATTAAGLAPLVAWLAYERASGRGTGHRIGLHVDTGLVRDFLRAVSDWVLPGTVSSAVAALAAVAIVAVAAAVAWRGGSPARLLVLYAVVQVVVLAVAHTFVDAGVTIEPRELIYPFVALVMAGAITVSGRAGWVVPAAALVALALVRGGLDVGTRPPGGYSPSESLRSVNWSASPIMAAVRALPADTVVYTNAPDALYLLTGRATASVPETQDFSTLEVNARYRDQLGEMRATLAHRPAVVVYVRGLPRSAFVPSEASLRRALDLRPVDDVRDGAVYRLAPGG